MKGHIEEEKIALLAGGDLAASDMPAAAAHVARCSSYSAVLESYRQKRQAMAAFRDTGISAGDFAEIRQSVLERLPGESRPHFSFFFPASPHAASVWGPGGTTAGSRGHRHLCLEKGTCAATSRDCCPDQDRTESLHPALGRCARGSHC